MIKLIVSDMDGTLLDDRGSFPADFPYVFDLLLQKNIIFCVASGRQYQSLKQFFFPYRQNICFIAENGAYVIHNEKEIYSNVIDKNLVNNIITSCRKIPSVGVNICGKNSSYMETTDPEIQEKISHYYLALQKVDDLTTVDDDILKIAIYDKIDAAENINKKLITPPSLKKVVSGSNWMDIANNGINKGLALENLQKKLGISPSETMVFGDYHNDLEMMSKGTHSFAMLNAQQEVKDASNFITEFDNNNNGVLRQIKKEILSL